MMPIQIFQINNIRECNYAFRSYEEALRDGFNPKDYSKVYDGYVDDTASLDDIFMIFNIQRPEDFRGHSLSVSDIIMTPDGTYYVDDIGFSPISLFDF